MTSTGQSARAATGPQAVRRPAGALRWTAAAVVALPEVWTLSAVAVGSFGLAALGYVEVAVVLAVALFVGLGHRWAYAAVVVLGLAGVVVGSVDPGMLSALYWVFGGLYALLGIGLLLGSRRRGSRGASTGPR